jgi:hypothetical protein
MMFSFFIVVLMVLPFAAASGLRNRAQNGLKNPHSKRNTKVGTMSYGGTFPANPVYSSINYYAGGCERPLTAVQNTLTGVCFTDGTISQKYTCCKL